MAIYIYVDSSTKKTSSQNKSGESVAAWAAWRDKLGEKPILCGINYFRYNGPNKTFYEGLIRALEQCLSMCWGDEVILAGDCELVIKQLNGEYKVGTTILEYKQVGALIGKYKMKNNKIIFKYLNQRDPIYKKVDQLAKRSHSHINSILK